jgi:Flp pilus assembly protein TadB
MNSTVVVIAGAVAAFIYVLIGGSGPRKIAGASTANRGLPKWLAPLLIFVGCAVLIGGPLGILIGLAIAGGATVVLPTFESVAARRDRLSREKYLPLFVDLVAACLAAGVNTDDSLLAAARAVGPPLSNEIELAVISIRWGSDPIDVWASVGEIDGLRELAMALTRSLESGASLAELLPQLAHDARDRKRTRVEARTRTAGVRLMGPLGLMFLPAYILLGVVPVVASWASLILGM